MFRDKMCCAIIAGGGSSQRFGGAPKLFAELGGKPVIAWSAELMQNSAFVDLAVMVMSDEQLPKWADAARAGNYTKFSAIRGGACRQASVYAGLMHLSGRVGSDAIVIIHDGARPLASPESLAAVIEAAYRDGAALCAVAARDTVKEAVNALVVKTPERGNMYLAQTPQAFRLDLIIEAHKTAADQGFAAYDDATLAERLGADVRLVPGSYSNIKITEPRDLLIAEVLLKTNAV